ncbi:MAG TPA: S1 RNA-binding domain-containing protein, partial [Planctomycetaceae bacterium]|nr:S1 RNA-binding domain-containing protein [Planctomycetaceae bacterium]
MMNGDDTTTLAQPSVDAPETTPPAPAEETGSAPPPPGDAVAAAPESQPAPVAEPDSSEDAEKPRRKVQLNPTLSAETARPVPTYGESAQGETPATAPETTSAPPVDYDAVMMPQNLGTIELPKDAPLSADMEAEIDAALGAAMTAPPPQPVAAGNTEAPPLPALAEQLESGTKLKAKVQSLSAEHVFCDVGYPAPGAVPIKQFPTGKHPNIGEEFLVVVDKYDTENGMILVSLPKATRRPRGNWEELQQGQIVECVVNKTNKGGLEVTISNMRAFLPASQVDLGFVASMEAYVGQRFPVQITEVNPAKRNLVVSRRALLIADR